jgi:hypothetical protein
MKRKCFAWVKGKPKVWYGIGSNANPRDWKGEGECNIHPTKVRMFKSQERHAQDYQHEFSFWELKCT